MPTFPGKERLSLDRVQRQHLSNQSKHRPKRRKNRSLSDWTSDEIQEELWLIVEALNKKCQFQLQSGGRTEQGSATLRTLVHLAEVESISDSVRAFNARAGP